MYTVYALIDPRDNTVHYVGQTNDVYQRFSEHINGRDGSSMKNDWIFELRTLNRMVVMEALEDADTLQHALERETYWIKHFEMLREPLSNVANRNVVERVARQLRLMTDIQAAQFIAAYKIRPNMDYCLKAAGCSSLYREHARQLMRENGLNR